MKVKNLSLDCRKPIVFKNNTKEYKSSGRMLKKFVQMDDDVLMLKSAIKAERDVNKSAKMNLLKAVPAITTAVIGTSIAITQPGKLADKVATGLGFVALANLTDLVSSKIINKVEKKANERTEKLSNAKKLGIQLGSLVTIASAAAGIFTAVKKSNAKFPQLIKSDLSKAAREINESKLGKLFEKKVFPFEKNHQKLIEALALTAFTTASCTETSIQDNLKKSLAKDFENKTMANFKNSKEIQKIARQEFDKLDAEEV